MGETKAIIMDLQGTLLENGVYPSPIKQVKYFLRVNRPFQDYVPVFEKSFMTRSYANLDEAFRQVCVDFNIRVPDFVIEKLVGLWNKNKLLSKPFHDSIEFLKQAKSHGYKLILVANIDCFSKEVIDKYGFREYFDEVMLSCETGMLKSNPKFFHEPLARLGVSPDDAVMIGDSFESDVESARHAGIKAVLIDRNDARDYNPKVANFQEFISYLTQGEMNGNQGEEQSSD